LTPGPLLSGIRAEGQMCAGGISFIFKTIALCPSRGFVSWQMGGFCTNRCRPSCCLCYTDATANGIRERVGAASGVCALVAFGTKSKFGKTIHDATNYRFLTTSYQGCPSGLADKIGIISSHGVIYTDLKNSSWTSNSRKRPTLWLRGPPRADSS